jgi:hypothetical protein
MARDKKTKRRKRSRKGREEWREKMMEDVHVLVSPNLILN